MARQMATVFIIVEMEHSLMVNLEMDKNMASELILCQMENREWENGKMEEEYSGFIKIKKYDDNFLF